MGLCLEPEKEIIFAPQNLLPDSTLMKKGLWQSRSFPDTGLVAVYPTPAAGLHGPAGVLCKGQLLVTVVGLEAIAFG